MIREHTVRTGMRQGLLSRSLCVSVFPLLASFSTLLARHDIAPRLIALCPSLSSQHAQAGLAEELVAVVTEASLTHMVEKELLLAVVVAESRCSMAASSPRGAIGYMQLMPATAQWLGVDDPRSLRGNIFGGAKYLAMLLEEFDGDVELALAAYNAGPGSVRRHRGIPPFRETKKFVGDVLEYYRQLSSGTKLV